MSNTTKTIKSSFYVVVFLFVFTFLLPLTTHATYTASDVLGQLRNGIPTFTTKDSNNKTTPNNQGFNYPDGLALDTVHHRLFVSEFGNNRVLEYNLDSSNNLINHTPDHVLGQPDFSSGQVNQGGDPASTTMSSPEGLSYDSTRNLLFVADSFNNRVLIFNLASGITDGMSASNVLGQPNFTAIDYNQGGSPASTTMKVPQVLPMT